MKPFKLPLYFWCNVFGEISEMPQWVTASLFLALWAFFLGKNRAGRPFSWRHLWHGFGEVSWTQTFPWNRSWLNKNRFHEKEGQFLHTNGIYCVLLAINSSKQSKDNQCLARYRWCLLSVYHDIVTCSQWKLKNCLFFISLVDNHISPYF